MALTSSFAVIQNSLSLRCHGFNYASPKKLVSIFLFKPKSSLVTQNCNPRCSSGEHSVTKRMLNLTVAAMSMCGLLNSLTPLSAEEMELERYTDSKEGFTLLKPSSWTKESTQEAEVVKFAERSGEGGLPIYEFEYVVDSSRGGMKRIFSAAFVASKKLYLLDIVHSDKPESPLDSHNRMILEQVFHSFDAATLV